MFKVYVFELSSNFPPLCKQTDPGSLILSLPTRWRHSVGVLGTCFAPEANILPGQGHMLFITVPFEPSSVPDTRMILNNMY